MLRDTEREASATEIAAGRNLQEVAEDLASARRALEAVEARALAGVAAVLSEAVDRALEAVERLEKMVPHEWMCHGEAAEHLGLSPDALYRAVGAGAVPRHCLTGNVYRYSRRELDVTLMR